MAERTTTKNFLFIHVNEWAEFASPDAIPISQAYALTYLTRHGFSGRLLGDYQDIPLAPEEVRSAIEELQPAAVGFSVYEENINRVRVWARFVKKIAPGVITVLGGPQITFMPARALEQMSEVDILARGEGETVMLALARAIEEDRGLAEVPAICYTDDNGRIIETPAVEAPADLDLFPSPYLDGVIDPAGKRRVLILSSRGCTSPCTFCYTTRASGRRVRFHSIDRVIAEMRYLKGKGIVDFWFADPNFAYSRPRLTALLERIIREVPGIVFWCQTRYNLIDPELLGLLRRAGAHTVAFGLESARPQVLAQIKKGLDLDRLAAAIRLVQKAGIAVELFSLFGLPGETLEAALTTLDFVKDHQVAIDGNSISQQLHIFFGTPINDEPAAHGIKPLPMTKPAYSSICRDFETTGMSGREIRRMSMIWRLNRKDFEENVRYRTHLFETAGFITSNYELLKIRPEADILLGRIYLGLEEYDLALRHILRLQECFPDHPAARTFLASPLTTYKIIRRGKAGPGCRVIYDCKGSLAGKVVSATEGFYQEAVLGDGRLLPDFERAILGLQAGHWTQCEVLFPREYGHQGLAGKTVTFQILLHLVMAPVPIENPLDLLAQAPRNIYRFHDLAGLRTHNENLYYLVLKDTVIRGLTQDMTDFLAFMNLLLKLGIHQKAEGMLHLLGPDRNLRTHAGRIFLANGLAQEALDILTPISGDDPEVEGSRIKALIQLGRYEEAAAIADNPALADDVRTLDLRVGLAALQGLSLTAYLARMDTLLDHQVQAMLNY